MRKAEGEVVEMEKAEGGVFGSPSLNQSGAWNSFPCRERNFEPSQ